MSFYTHIDSIGGNTPGTSDTFYLAPIRWFKTLSAPSPSATPFSPTNNPITIYDNHVFKAGYGFIIGKSAHNTALFKIIAQGLNGSKSFNTNFTFFIAGNSAALHETMSRLLNEQLVVLVSSARCNNAVKHQIGNQCISATFQNMEYATGSIDGSERKGYNCTIQATTHNPRLYTGDTPKHIPTLGIGQAIIASTIINDQV